MLNAANVPASSEQRVVAEGGSQATDSQMWRSPCCCLPAPKRNHGARCFGFCGTKDSRTTNK